MEHIRDALLRLVKAGVAIKKLQETYLQCGLDDDPLFNAYGEIADAICILTGEHKNTFEETTTHLALTVPGFDAEHRVRVLMAEYKRNHPEQPAPHFINRDEMRKSVKRNGGYISPEGDWSL
jgi:hypothetical protein